MNNFYLSDPHIAHQKILEITPRGLTFSSIEEHDETIVENINKKVGRKDKLYLLGDIGFYNSIRKFRTKLNCKNIDVCVGNHDKKNQLYQVFGFNNVWEIRVTKFSNNEKVVLCHYPMIYYPSSFRGAYQLYGHLHSARETYLDNLFPDRRSMDVGIDNYHRLFGKYDPFSEEEILSILSDRKGHDNLEFYREEEKWWKK